MRGRKGESEGVKERRERVTEEERVK